MNALVAASDMSAKKVRMFPEERHDKGTVNHTPLLQDEGLGQGRISSTLGESRCREGAGSLKELRLSSRAFF